MGNLRNLSTDGARRQKLSNLVKQYARARGIIYSIAWTEFRRAYSATYHTDLDLDVKNFQGKIGCPVSIPDYLESADKLPQAIKVMEALLQGKAG